MGHGLLPSSLTGAFDEVKIIEHHLSPDGFLKLIVCAEPSGDISVGFDGFSWHTHGDVLASTSGLTQDQALRRFVDDIVCGRTIIAVSRLEGEVRDVWPTEDPERELRHVQADEMIEFRCWDGPAQIVEPDRSRTKAGSRSDP